VGAGDVEECERYGIGRKTAGAVDVVTKLIRRAEFEERRVVKEQTVPLLKNGVVRYGA
jgi:hypothetical protein